MTALTVVVVDDERLARVQLVELLLQHPHLCLAGEASSGEEATELIGRTRPDVIFLDVQMPRLSGFDVLERIEAGPRVVFVTAHDRHAVRAFEVNALDFLMKPVSRERFARTVERLSASSPALAAELPRLDYQDRLFLTLDRHPHFLRLSEITCITAADDYAEIHTRAGRSALVAQPLRHWELRLPAAHFARIHRSALVNFDAITRIDEQAGGGCLVHLEGSEQPIAMSRRFAEALRRRFR
jgi:two-component system, LytTR family, response regulator